MVTTALAAIEMMQVVGVGVKSHPGGRIQSKELLPVPGISIGDYVKSGI